MPLALSDSQLDQIFRCAEPLPPADRSRFLEDVAAALDGQDLGDGLVARTCRDVQHRYLRPPSFSAGPPAKYRR